MRGNLHEQRLLPHLKPNGPEHVINALWTDYHVACLLQKSAKHCGSVEELCSIHLKAQCVTFKGIYWHEIE